MNLNLTKDITTKIVVSKGHVANDTIAAIDKVQEDLITATTDMQAVNILVRYFPLVRVAIEGNLLKNCSLKF